MGGVAQQGDRAAAPVLERIAVQQRPSARRAGLPDEALQAVVPSCEFGEKLLDGRGGAPGLGRVAACWGEGDQVDRGLAGDRVVHQMVAGTDPQRLGTAAGEARGLLGRHDGPERADPRVPRGRRIGYRAAHCRVHAIGPDHHVSLGAGPVGECQHRAVAVNRDAGAAPAQPDCSRWDGAGDRVVQVGPVSGIGALTVQPLA